METDRAFERYDEAVRGRLSGDALRERLAALAVLRDYFLDYAGITDLAGIDAEDIRDFAFHWLIRSGEATPASAGAALQAVRDWLEHAAGHLDPARRPAIMALATRFTTDVPRVLEAAQLISAAARGDAAAEFGLSTEEDEEDEAGSVSAGIDRIVALDPADYERAEQDEFRVTEVGPDRLTLVPVVPEPEIEALAREVAVPAEAAALLLPGDVLSADLAPTGDGWQVLDVLAIYPGDAAGAAGAA